MAIKQHKLRSRIVIVVAVAVIFSALVFSLFRAAIPYITNYGADIERELTAQLGKRVEIGMIDADISWLVPRLRLLDVSVYDEEDNRHLIHFMEISVSLNWIESIKNLKPELGDVFLFGMDLQIERNENGQFLIQGINISESANADASDSGGAMKFLSETSFYLVDSTIHWIDQINNSQRLDLTKVNLAMINNGIGHKVSVGMDLPAAYGRHLQIMGDFEGDIGNLHSWKGIAYVNAEKIQLDAWLNDYWALVGFPGSGQLTANAWVSFDGLSVKNVSIELSADDLVIYHLDEDIEAWKLDHISAVTKWSQTDESMMLNIRDLHVQRNNEAWSIASAADLEIFKSQKIQVTTNYARLEDLLYFTGIADVIRHGSVLDALPVADARSVRGDLYNVNLLIDLDRPDEITASAYFVDFGYQSISSAPSIYGMDGYLKIEPNQVVIDIESNNVAFEFKDLFRDKLKFEYLTGSVEVSKKLADWIIESKKVIARSPHIKTDSSLKIVVPENGSVFMDIVTTFYQGDGSHVSEYLPAGIMGKKTVDWLDHAIVRASIPQGGFLFFGEVNDFPFHKGEGVMEVLFDIEDARLQYLPDWPAITGLKSTLLFYNSSFYIDGATGYVYGADLSDVNVSIENLSEPHLSIDGDIVSPLSDLVLFVRNSPLKNILGSFVAGLRAKGSSSLDLDLQIPLDKGDNLKVNGLLSFENNEIFLPDQGYLLDTVNGQLLFSEASVSAEKLQANMAGYPVNAIVGPYVVADKSVTRIDVSGRLPVKNILSAMPVLMDYMDGIADWNVNIDIPVSKTKKQPSAIISIMSDLQGVSSTLPLPFKKATDSSVPFKMTLDVLPDNALAVAINYDKSNGLQANYADHLWDISLQSSQLKGAILFSAESPLGYPVRVNLDYLNLSAFMGETKKAGEQSISVVELPSIEFKAKEIAWNNISFKNISLKTHKIKSGMMIDVLKLDGPDIHLTGKGSWISTWRHENLTKFDFQLSTDNLGRCLTNLNLTNGIEDAKGTGDFKWKWSAAPYEFKWDLLEGMSTLILEDGKLVDIQPGAGRILGIFNFETLLSLDFGKQMSGGFAFDEIKGAFTFANGNAYTENFKIEGKVADINIKGRVGLTAEDFDQTISVIPGVGSTLSVIGAVAGGATIGAAILFFQKILGLDKIAEYKYSVTGPWSNPKVTLLSAPKKEKKLEKNSNDDF